MAARYENFKGGLTTNDPLTSGGTTLNSTALADLLTVAAPDTVWLVLDPEAVNGDPEIVQVTVHTAAATSATIVRAQQGTTARSHPVDTAWVLAATKSDLDELPFRKVTTKGDILAASAANVVTRVGAGANGTVLQALSSESAGVKFDTLGLSSISAALLEILCPAGTIRPTIYGSADTGWLLFGQTVVGAQSTYPTLWSKAPTAWKSGSDLVLPTDDEMVLRGNTAGIGDVSGTNTKTIDTANLPAHTHGIDHDHANASAAAASSGAHTHTGTTGIESTQHAHTFSATSGGQSVTHEHWGPGGTTASLLSSVDEGYGTYVGVTGGGIGPLYNAVTGEAGNDHTHAVSGTTSGTSTNHTHSFTSASDGAHTHDVNLPAFTGTSGSTGSGTALNVQEAGINVRFQIKAH